MKPLFRSHSPKIKSEENIRRDINNWNGRTYIKKLPISEIRKRIIEKAKISTEELDRIIAAHNNEHIQFLRNNTELAKFYGPNSFTSSNSDHYVRGLLNRIAEYDLKVEIYSKDEKYSIVSESQKRVYFELRSRGYSPRLEWETSGMFIDIAFIEPEHRLAIEIDGPYHENEKQVVLDKWKDIRLMYIGYNVIRFSAESAYNSTKEVANHIEEKLKDTKRPVVKCKNGKDICEWNSKNLGRIVLATVEGRGEKSIFTPLRLEDIIIDFE